LKQERMENHHARFTSTGPWSAGYSRILIKTSKAVKK